MTLEQQWQEDVRQFGDNAYLMWEIQRPNSEVYVKPSSNSNIIILTQIGLKHPIRRKQSAALPFDLVAAFAGDEIETLHGGLWKRCKFISVDENGFLVFIPSNNIDKYREEWDLRMKHPRRVGVDYSQFEDKE